MAEFRGLMTDDAPSEIPAALLSAPVSRDEALVWLDLAVGLIGPRFDPNIPFGDYLGVQSRESGEDLEISDEHEAALDEALRKVRSLVGSEANLRAFQAAERFLEAIDMEWRVWARPATQPSPSWWLAIASSQESGKEIGKALVFFDQHANWWEYDPDTRLMRESSLLPWQVPIPPDYEVWAYSQITPDDARAHIEAAGGPVDERMWGVFEASTSGGVPPSVFFQYFQLHQPRP
jgi:hypothetical protein